MQLVGDVQAPAVDAAPEPVAHDPVLARDELHERRRLGDRRDAVEATPALVVGVRAAGSDGAQGEGCPVPVPGT